MRKEGSDRMWNRFIEEGHNRHSQNPDLEAKEGDILALIIVDPIQDNSVRAKRPRVITIRGHTSGWAK